MRGAKKIIASFHKSYSFIEPSGFPSLTCVQNVDKEFAKISSTLDNFGSAHATPVEALCKPPIRPSDPKKCIVKPVILKQSTDERL
mgnify:CR=1 FL=1